MNQRRLIRQTVWMEGAIKKKYSHKEIIVVTYRNSVIRKNRIIVFFMVVGSIIGTIFWNWISVLFLVPAGWFISIINSISAAKKIQELTGLSHEEQAVIWYKIREDYERTRK